MSQNTIHKSFQMTIRGLPVSLMKELKKEAQIKKLSLNQVVLDRILPESEKTKEGACAELMDLAGTWDEKRAGDFEASMKDHRTIDPELW